MGFNKKAETDRLVSSPLQVQTLWSLPQTINGTYQFFVFVDIANGQDGKYNYQQRQGNTSRWLGRISSLIDEKAANAKANTGPAKNQHTFDQIYL